MQTIMQRAKCRRRAASLLVPNNSRIWRQPTRLGGSVLFGSLADIGERTRDVSFAPKADVL
jgi:hypothetical protein